MSLEGLPSRLRVANCVSCDCLISGDYAQLAKLKTNKVSPLRGRIKGRPYCSKCLDVSGAGVSGLAGGMATDFGSPSPWQENAIRFLED